MDKLLAIVTEAVREADETFKRTGGGTRHWVRDCFFPALADREVILTDSPVPTEVLDYIIALENRVALLEKQRFEIGPLKDTFEAVQKTRPDWWPNVGDEVECNTRTVGGVVYARQGRMISFRDEHHINYRMDVKDVIITRRKNG